MIKKKASELPIDDFHKIELGKILDATQSLYTTRVTVASGAATIAIAILAVAFSDAFNDLRTIQAVLFFAVAGFTIIVIILDSIIKTMIATHYLRCLEIINRFAIDDINALTSVYKLSPKAIAYIHNLVKEPYEIRHKEMRYFGLKFRSFVGFWLPLLNVVADVMIGLLLLFAL